MKIKLEEYKIYQLMEFFVVKYSFNNVLIRELNKDDETWLFNKENKDFQLIRISSSTLDQTFSDQSRINNYINFVSRNLKINAKFIDIHISNEEPTENEIYTTTCLNSNYISGYKIENVFPGINNIIHDVDNKENEIYKIIASMNTSVKQRNIDKRNIRKAKSRFSLNNIFIGINIFMFIVELLVGAILFRLPIFNQIFSVNSNVLVLLGANYKLFTSGYHEYYRLITYSFLHGGIIHLAFNMYSLNYVGRYIEQKYGKIKYILLVILSSIVGALTLGILSPNSLTIGFSGCIYAMFTVFVIDIIKNHNYNINSLMSVIFINLLLNFMSGVAWQVHLGGVIIGFIFFYAFENDKINYPMLVLLVILIIGLGYKYFSTPLYSLANIENIQILNNLISSI